MPLETVRIPFSINPLVVVADNRGYIRVEVDLLQNRLTDCRVLLHQSSFLKRKRTFLQEETRGEADFPNVVDEAA